MDVRTRLGVTFLPFLEEQLINLMICIHNGVSARQNPLKYQLFLSPYNKITVFNRAKLYLALDLVVI